MTKVFSSCRNSYRNSDYFSAAFEDFLQHFKTSSVPREAAGAFDVDVDVDGDDISDEYDFAESDEEMGQARRVAERQARAPKLKYFELLQEVANRTTEEIIIELDDLALVSLCTSLTAMVTDLVTVRAAA